MKVYVITKGCYSDYHIVGVSLDKTRAEEIANAVSEEPKSLYEAHVEEYDTDAFVTGFRYFVWYDRYNKWNASIDDYDEHQINHAYSDRRFVVYAKDTMHAVKIAQDMRAEYLAKEKGVSD